MNRDEIIALRKDLRCTRNELAEALGVAVQLLQDWEKERKFPTKRHVERMRELREQGPSAVPRKRRPQAKAELPPNQALSDPEVWTLIRKLLAHADLRDKVKALADDYSDPGEPSADDPT